jgi:hypothetical protein
MAADQHYCIECGQRRGNPRFPFMEGVAQRSREQPTPQQPRRPWLNANSTLIAGVATLLLALGVGVLIGRSSNGSSPKSAPVQVLTVAGGAGAAGATGTAASTPTTSTPANSAAAAAAGAKNAKITHTSTKGAFTTKAPPPKVVTVGGSCSNGQKGCQGGKFTGNFFGG